MDFNTFASIAAVFMGAIYAALSIPINEYIKKHRKTLINDLKTLCRKKKNNNIIKELIDLSKKTIKYAHATRYYYWMILIGILIFIFLCVVNYIIYNYKKEYIITTNGITMVLMIVNLLTTTIMVVRRYVRY